jgi:lipopolysaccharide transport system permease protein
MTSKKFPVSVPALVRSLVQHHRLIFSLTARDLSSRYKSSVLGALWLELQPLIQLAVYWFVFSTISKSHWDPKDGGGDLPFGLIIFPGLVAFGIVSEALVRGPALVTANVSYVKRLIFPLEILPVINSAASVVAAALGMLIVVLMTLVMRGELYWSILLVPVPLAALVIFAAGLSWLLSAIGVLFRDLSQLTSNLTTILLFTAPIVYPATMLPDSARDLVRFNPLTIPIEAIRGLLFAGAYDEWEMLGLYAVIVSLFAWASFAFFQRLRVGFADVL